ncbi:MAG: efflux RND transporter periplasmic adaptor subunit [Nitrospirae bacterium]|nr:efflux RND transporter periplasmic adaptor subunit [Magnetococcales bacterium]HAT49892.1 efflux RND transporter periplasmic adaptor subunit [Alphaproteobacteria bacterium]
MTQKSGVPLFVRWKLVSSIILLTLSTGLGVYFYGPNAEQSATTDWVTARVSRGAIEETTTALGMLQPLNTVDVGTQVSGQLRKIHVALGDAVQEGDLLAEIDATLLAARVESDRAQLEGLQAQWDEKTAQYTLAKAQYTRQRQLLTAKTTSRESFQSAETAHKVALAQLNQLKAQMRQVQSTLRGDEANLGYTRIFAPMAGTVVAMPARQGQTLNANQQAPILLRIADLNTMTVWTQVSEADIGRLKPGMEAYFTTLGQPNQRHYGHLRQILPTPEIINNVILYDALFDVENSNGTLGIQMSAQVSFVHAFVKEALSIPVTALAMADKNKNSHPSKKYPQKNDNTNATVLVVHNDQVESRRITVGIKTRLQVQVISGLEEGEEVVIALRKPNAAPPSSRSPLSGGGRPSGGFRPHP